MTYTLTAGRVSRSGEWLYIERAPYTYALCQMAPDGRVAQIGYVTKEEDARLIVKAVNRELQDKRS